MAEAAEKTGNFDPKSLAAEVKGGITPYLTIQGATKAVEFYKKAFGAEVAAAMPPDDTGRTMHIHLYINGGSLMMADPYPEHCGGRTETPGGFNLTLQVEDVDGTFARAVEAGATATMPPADMFWGARYAQVRDPFGVTWAFNHPL